MNLTRIYTRIFLALLTIVIFARCGDKPVEHGTEYTLNVPGGTDSAIVKSAIAVLNSRLTAFGLDESDFDILTDAGSIKVRVAEGKVKDPVQLRKVLTASAQLTFRAMYDLAELGGMLDSANKTYMRITGLDTIDPQRQGFFKYFIPAYDFTQQNGAMPILMYCKLQDTAAVNAILQMDSVRICFPSDMIFMWGQANTSPDEEPVLSLLACKVGRNHELSGDHVASADLSEGDFGPTVNLTFDATGKDEWAKMTKENKGRNIAIEVDGFVYSYPVVQEEITGGQAQITGPEAEDMKNLSYILKAGKMPVRLIIVSESTV